jgi:hypothetical protein
MTPKEKAKELTNKYFKGSDLLYHDLSWIQAKECAIIACEEILKTFDEEWTKLDFWTSELEEVIKYWQQVKTEIENL